MPMEPTIVRGDLLAQEVDVIVNSWNRNIIPWWLLLPQGVSGAIKKRGGYAPFREVARHGPIPLGGAVLTGAGRLPFQGIIHVAGINLCGGRRSVLYATRCGTPSLSLRKKASPRSPCPSSAPAPAASMHSALYPSCRMR